MIVTIMMMTIKYNNKGLANITGALIITITTGSNNINNNNVDNNDDDLNDYNDNDDINVNNNDKNKAEKKILKLKNANHRISSRAKLTEVVVSEC